MISILWQYYGEMVEFQIFSISRLRHNKQSGKKIRKLRFSPWIQYLISYFMLFVSSSTEERVDGYSLTFQNMDTGSNWLECLHDWLDCFKLSGGSLRPWGVFVWLYFYKFSPGTKEITYLSSATDATIIIMCQCTVFQFNSFLFR